MDVGIGLPNTLPGTTGGQITAWARRAEERGFSTLGTIDRIVYPNYEPLIALAGAAAVTERIGLATTVLLGPLRASPAILAKQALSLNTLADGRFTLGIAIGAREDDYEVTGADMRRRGATLDHMLERMTEIWSGEEVGPRTAGAPRLIVGGSVEAAYKRAARFGDGWIATGSTPEQFAEMAEQARAAWSEAGRPGQPHIMGLGYYSLGERAEENAREYLLDYYAWLGEIAEAIATGAAKDPETVRQYLSAFEERGCDEFVFFPSSPEVEQVDLLADACGL
jgi:alkanesulfonate monooxygenase SsuD/methylene tetrahydromethanopterin reductase-like flavin-dependent oxidoreductase (luciferase family)